MPPSCLSVDPVELLLRGILRRSALVAAAAAAAACSAPLAHEPEDGCSHAGRERDEAGLANADDRAACAARGGSGPADAAAADRASLGTSAPPAGRTPDAGALGPMLECKGPNRFPVAAAGLKTTESYDYLALRERRGGPESTQGDSDPDRWTSYDFTLLSETGTKCAAAHASDCAEKIAHHPAQYVRIACGQACSELSAVTTRGDDVQRWVGLKGTRALLGEIDTPDEALLLVGAAGYFLTCNDAEATSWRSTPDGYEVYATLAGSGSGLSEITRHHLRVSKSGEISDIGSIVLERLSGAGRRPAGLLSSGRELGRSRFGDYLARMAHLEAASVIAFERMARELEAFGAPRPLIDAALAARADEVRHAEIVGRLALAHRGELVEPEVAPMVPRTLEEMALENAVEGCVRETYGALVGGHQAVHALNRSLRAVMVRIAQDEARHASLSHQVQRWVMPRLSRAARERVRHAQQRAVFELAAEVAVRPDVEVASLAGLPGPEVGRVLLAELSKTLWRSALRQRRAGTALG